MKLSPQERKVKRLRVAGKTVRAIAEKMGLTIETIRSYLKAVHRKTGTHSAIELSGDFAPNKQLGKGRLEYLKRQIASGRSRSECWIWPFRLHRSGYAHLAANGNPKYPAHRLAYELATGMTIPKHLKACHTCDNPGCFNPSHVFPGTQAMNVADMLSKGRGTHQRHRVLTD